MSFINLAEIPGYAEACAKEQAARDLAFIDLPVPLCGITARQFTLRHLLLLGQCENPLVCGGRAAFGDIAIFLWFVSTDYSLDKKKEHQFIRALRLRPQAALAEIDEYLARAFIDAPDGRSGGKTYASQAAYAVDLLASEYGWPDDLILEMPVARVYQYVRMIQHRYNPKMPLINRSDAKISEMLRARNGVN